MKKHQPDCVLAPEKIVQLVSYMSCKTGKSLLVEQMASNKILALSALGLLVDQADVAGKNCNAMSSSWANMED